jgi:hypothetical protein
MTAVNTSETCQLRLEYHVSNPPLTQDIDLNPCHLLAPFRISAQRWTRTLSASVLFKIHMVPCRWQHIRDDLCAKRSGLPECARCSVCHVCCVAYCRLCLCTLGTRWPVLHNVSICWRLFVLETNISREGNFSSKNVAAFSNSSMCFVFRIIDTFIVIQMARKNHVCSASNIRPLLCNNRSLSMQYQLLIIMFNMFFFVYRYQQYLPITPRIAVSQISLFSPTLYEILLNYN